MFRMAACRYAAMLIVEPMLREYTVDTIYQTTDLDTIYSLLAKRCERDPDDLIAQWQDDETRQWHDVSAGQMNDRVREVAKGLLGLGVKPGSMVVIYAATCYEWGVVDFACASIGAVSVPVYETDSPKQTGDIVAEVEPVIAFAGDDSHAQILEQIRAHSESLRYVFNFKANGRGTGQGDRPRPRRRPVHHRVHVGLHRQTEGRDAVSPQLQPHGLQRL